MKGSSRDPFNGAADGTQTAPDYGKPVSVRFTEEERAELERMAGALWVNYHGTSWPQRQIWDDEPRPFATSVSGGRE